MANPDHMGLSSEALKLIDDQLRLVRMMEVKIEKLELQNIHLKSEVTKIKQIIHEYKNDES